MYKMSLTLAAAALLLAACGGGGDATLGATEQPQALAATTVTPTAAPTVAPPALTDGLLNPEAKLAAAMTCSPNFGPDAGKAVLLIPAATMDVESELSWTYIPALNKLNMPWCAVDLPFKNTGELQNASEYVTYAIRKMFSVTKTKLGVIGFSQGGVLGRWPLKYFPDTRAMVEDYVGVAASHHGLIETNLLCAVPVLGCITSFTQISIGSKWIDALNAGGETFEGIDYTQVYTRTDDVAIPNFDEARGVSSLRTGNGKKENIATQDICLLNLADHFQAISYDPVPFAIAVDALKNDGPASPARVRQQGLGLCLQLVAPGVDLLAFPVNFATKTMLTFVTSVALMPKATKEPPLREYVKF